MDSWGNLTDIDGSPESFLKESLQNYIYDLMDKLWDKKSKIAGRNEGIHVGTFKHITYC